MKHVKEKEKVMIKVISKMVVKEDKVEEFIELFRGMVEPTRQEEGCLQYAMYQDEEDPATLSVVESWEGREAFDRHLTTEHFKRIVPAMMELMAGETDLSICRPII